MLWERAAWNWGHREPCATPFRSRRRAVGVRPNALTMRGYDELHLLPMTSGRKSLFLQRLQLIE